MDLASSLWNAVDGMLVINLDTCMQRMEQFREVNAALPQEKLQRQSACLGRALPGYGEAPWFTERTGERASNWAGAAGCAVSHRRAIETARDKGWKNVLILEDDARLNLSEAAATLISRALADLRGAYMLYLGYNRPVPHGHPVAEEGAASLWQVDGVLATHAYIVSAPAYDILLNCLPTEEQVWEWLARYRAIDTFYRDYVAAGGMLPVYAVYPTIFAQSAGVSSISGEVVADDNCACERAPYPVSLLYRLMSPFRRLKTLLNSVRTHRRALRGGFPGYRRKQTQV